MSYDFAFTNLQQFEVQADVGAADTTISVPDTIASEVEGALQSAARYPLIISSNSTLTAGSNFEIVYATAADTQAGTLDVVRGQEGTTAQFWSANTIARSALTAAALDEIRGEVARTRYQAGQIVSPGFPGKLDLTTAGDSVKLDVPAGFDSIYINAFQVILTDFQSSQANLDGARIAAGTTDGASDIMDPTGPFLELGELDYYFTNNEDFPISVPNGEIYVWTETADASATTANLRVGIRRLTLDVT